MTIFLWISAKSNSQYLSTRGWSCTLQQMAFILAFHFESLNFFINILVLRKRKLWTVHILLKMKVFGQKKELFFRALNVWHNYFSNKSTVSLQRLATMYMKPDGYYSLLGYICFIDLCSKYNDFSYKTNTSDHLKKKLQNYSGIILQIICISLYFFVSDSFLIKRLQSLTEPPIFPLFIFVTCMGLKL